MPVRLATPQGISGLTEMVKNPIYSTAVGLLLYGQKQVEAGMNQHKGQPPQAQPGVMEKVKTWFKGNF